MDKNEIKTDLMNFMYVKGFRKKNVFNLNFDNKDPEFVKKRNDNFYRATHYNLKALSVYENLIKKVTNGKDILDIAKNSNYINAVVHQAIDNEVLYDEDKLNPEYQLDEYNKQIEDIVNKRNAEEQVRNNPKNSKKNYDNYITLHCGSKMGKTKEEMIDNIAKIEAARRLKKVGVKFDVKEIHKGATRLKERYFLDSLKQMDEKIIKSALRDGRSASGFLRIMRKKLYKIEPNNYKAYDSYLKEMKTVLNSMSKPDGRSKEYQNFYNSIKAITEIDISTARKNEKERNLVEKKLINANDNLFDAVVRYTTGKEGVRVREYGKKSFNNALDAIATMNKFAKGSRIGTKNLIYRVNAQRKPKEKITENLDEFTAKYGADRAASAVKEKAEKNPPVKEAKQMGFPG